jgi:hypothetical protein
MRVVKGTVIVVLIIPHAGLLLIHDVTRFLSGQAERCLRWYDDLVKRPAGWAYGERLYK